MASLSNLLYVASELDFFPNGDPLGPQLRKIAEKIAENGEVEVRCFIPRFGLINQRTNNIHEILRLSGINVPMGNGDVSLVVKVASLRNSKLQVYFIDNETFFERKSVFTDANGNFFPDNDARTIFFCKAVLVTIEKLDWAPDIIHCHDWMSSFVPLYLKSLYRTSSTLGKALSIYTCSDAAFSHDFQADTLLQHARRGGIAEESLAPLQEKPNFQGFTELALRHADYATRTFLTPDQPGWKGVDYTQLPLLDYQAEGAAQAYTDLYQKLLAAR